MDILYYKRKTLGHTFRIEGDFGAEADSSGTGTGTGEAPDINANLAADLALAEAIANEQAEANLEASRSTYSGKSGSSGKSGGGGGKSTGGGSKYGVPAPLDTSQFRGIFSPATAPSAVPAVTSPSFSPAVAPTAPTAPTAPSISEAQLAESLAAAKQEAANQTPLSGLTPTDVGSFSPVASVTTGGTSDAGLASLAPAQTAPSTAKPGETTMAQTASQTGGTNLSSSVLDGTIDLSQLMAGNLALSNGTKLGVNQLTQQDLNALQAMGFGNLQGLNKNNPTQSVDELANSFALNNFMTENMPSPATLASMVAGPLAGIIVNVATNIAQGKSATSVIGNVVGGILGQVISQITGIPVSIDTLTALVDGQVGRAGLSVAFNAIANQTGLPVSAVQAGLSGNLGAAVQNTLTGAITSEAAKSLGVNSQFIGQVLGSMGLSTAGANVASAINQIAAPLNEATAKITDSVSKIGVPTGVNNLAGAISSGAVNTTPVAEGGNQDEYLRQVALNSGLSPAQAQANSTPTQGSTGSFGGIKFDLWKLYGDSSAANNKLPVVATPPATGTAGTTGAMQGGFGSGMDIETDLTKAGLVNTGTTGSGTTGAMQGGFGSATGVTSTTGGAADASTGTTQPDTEWGDIQGAIDAATARGINAKAPTFSEAFSSWRTALGPNQEFAWTNPTTGETRLYTTNLSPTESEKAAQAIADQKRIDLMPVYGGAQNTRTGTPLNASNVYVNTKTGDVVVDTRVFDPQGNVVSGSLNLADEGTTTAALNTAVGSTIRTGLDIFSSIPRGMGSTLEQAGTLAGLTGLVDMNNIATRTGAQAKAAVDAMRSTDFKNNAALINAAIQKAGNEGFFAELVETGKQFGASPVQMAAFIVEQSPSLLIGGGGMAAAKALGAGMTTAAAASIGTNAAMQGASVAKEAYDDAIKAGKSPEDALSASRLAGSLASLASVVANKYIPGALSTEGMIAAQTAAKTSIRNALVGEMSAEVAEESAGQVVKNFVAGDPWDKGLGSTVAMSLMGSGVTTGLVHGAYTMLESQGVPARELDSAVNKIVDQGIVTSTEAVQIAKDLGYSNPSQEVLDSFVGPTSEADASAKLNTFLREISQYEAGKPVTAAVARDMMADLGLTNMSDADAISLANKIVQSTESFSPQINKQDIATIVDTALKANPSLTEAQVQKIVSDATAALPAGTTPEQAKAIVNSAITDLKASVQQDVTNTANAIKAEVAKNEAAGLSRDAALQKALETVSAAQKTDTASLLSKLGTTETALKTQVAGLDTKLSAAIEAAKASGLAGDAALKAAIDKVAADQNLSSANLLSKIGVTETALKTQFASELGGVKTQIAQLEQSLSDEIQAAKDIGLAGDAALQAGLNSLSAKMGTNQADLIKQLGTTEAALKTQFASQVTSLDAKLSKAIADAKAAGLAGDAALQAGLNSVATQMGVDKATLLGQIGKTETTLRNEIAAGQATTKAALSQLSAAQQKEVADRVAAGQATDAAIAAVKAQVTAGQTALQTQLTAQGKQFMDALVQQGMDQKTALETAINAQNAQIKTSQEATQKQISEFDTQLNARIDALTKTGMDQYTATQTAMRDMYTGLTGQIGEAEKQRQADVAAAAAQRMADQQAAAAAAAEAERKRIADVEAQKAQAAANLRTTQVGQLRGQMMTGLQGLIGGLQQQATQMAAPGVVETVKATPGFDFRSPLNVGFFSGYESQKVPPKGQESTKIAEGGYLDDLLDAIR